MELCRGTEMTMRWLMSLITSHAQLLFHTNNYPAGVGVSFPKQKTLHCVNVTESLTNTPHTCRRANGHKRRLLVSRSQPHSLMYMWVWFPHTAAISEVSEYKQSARCVYSWSPRNVRHHQTQSGASSLLDVNVKPWDRRRTYVAAGHRVVLAHRVLRIVMYIL